MKIRVMAGVLAAFLFFSCDQYPIFHAISQEVKPKDPRVKGSPTAMVELNSAIYVASRHGKTVHYYKGGKWDRMASPGGNIMEIATDGKYLYALAGDPLSETKVYYKDVVNGWNPVSFSAGGVMQTICGASEGSTGYIFASTGGGLFSYKTGSAGFSSDSLLPDLSKENIVTGAAYLKGVYYVAVVNKGIYTFSGTSPFGDPVGETGGEPIVGMLVVNDKIAAVSRESESGALFHGDSTSGFTKTPKGVAFSGAMGLWDAPSTAKPSLLLLGIQSKSYSTGNGYREIPLGVDGSLDPSRGFGLQRPGISGDSTVSNADRYASTMGLRVVTSLRQTPDKTLFASTMTHGLWSYRNNVWNAED